MKMLTIAFLSMATATTVFAGQNSVHDRAVKCSGVKDMGGIKMFSPPTCTARIRDSSAYRAAASIMTEAGGCFPGPDSQKAFNTSDLKYRFQKNSSGDCILSVTEPSDPASKFLLSVNLSKQEKQAEDLPSRHKGTMSWTFDGSSPKYVIYCDVSEEIVSKASSGSCHGTWGANENEADTAKLNKVYDHKGLKKHNTPTKNPLVPPSAGMVSDDAV